MAMEIRNNIVILSSQIMGRHRILDQKVNRAFDSSDLFFQKVQFSRMENVFKIH